MPTGGIRARTSGIMVPAFMAPATASYQGPGDVIATTAYAWWGFRAYKLSAIGQNAVDLSFLDSAVITYATIAGGGLNVTQIAADAVTHGTPIEVDKMYDQTGNGRDISHGAFARPVFVTTGNGLTVPNMSFTIVGGHNLTNTAFGTAPQPLTYGFVANHTATAVQADFMFTFAGGNAICPGVYRQAANNTVASFAGINGPDTALSDGTWAAVQSTYTNTTNDRFGVNSGQVTGTNFGANTLDTTFQISQGSAPFEGFGAEAGIWTIEFTGTQMTNMYQNQKAYYGLP